MTARLCGGGAITTLDLKSTLEVGERADLVQSSGGPLVLAPDELSNLAPIRTTVGGLETFTIEDRV